MFTTTRARLHAFATAHPTLTTWAAIAAVVVVLGLAGASDRALP